MRDAAGSDILSEPLRHESVDVGNAIRTAAVLPRLGIQVEKLDTASLLAVSPIIVAGAPTEALCLSRWLGTTLAAFHR
jgi:hypothetical protein